MRAVVRRSRRRLEDIPYFVICLPVWLVARRRLAQATVLGVSDLIAARRSDRVFVFGSSASLNEVAADEWGRMAEHDTFGFNWFVREDFIRCDFHLIRQIADSNARRVWEPQIREYCALIERSPHFRNTVLLLQHEWRARAANLALRFGWLPHRHRVFPWKTYRGGTQSPSFDDGLSHVTSTLCDTINAAVLMGWTEIVLVGVDLYDRRYFWLARDETRSVDEVRGAKASDLHTQASSGLIELIEEWHADLADRGIALSVHNPRSMLAGVLPVFKWT